MSIASERELSVRRLPVLLRKGLFHPEYTSIDIEETNCKCLRFYGPERVC